jgi:glycosyltransferase involved in cell wall biosynthesis
MRLLIPGKLEGIGWFSLETMRRLADHHPNTEFIFVYDRPIPKGIRFPNNVRSHRIILPARRPLLWKIWFDGSLNRLLKKWKPDLFYSPEGMMPLNPPCRSLITIHDLNFEHFPEDMPANYLRYYREYFPKFAERADRITTVSMASRNDIINLYRIDPNKIEVVYNGVNESYTALSPELVQKTRAEYSDGAPYFFYIGSFHRRKNIERMLKAYDHYRERGGEAKFLLVGEEMWGDGELEQLVKHMEHRADVQLLGRRSPEELKFLMGAAQALIFVSYFEGFGLPIVEGMRAGVPVLTSEASCMPEISGGATLLVNPMNEKLISDGMIALDDPDTRTRLIQKGLERSIDFSWERTATGIWENMLKALHA